ncbi:protein adenylyltransferase SelO [Cellvibrio sp.]|uniref:protein adenylyltransferase SelO n=1 Tax=Cellvibrio sp. TaxID=1965322 RepID=UPI0039647473
MSYVSLAELSFDNRFVRELPADPIVENYRRQVAGAGYSFVKPTRVSSPKLICASPEVADLIDLNHSELNTELFTQIFSGNQLLPDMQPHACCYGGHQFGNWAGQLGDGRAINLGEVKNAKGEHWTLQLKGAGPTPYSRTADGLAVLRSSIREFLCSEAMHHLGVPTTRALSLVLTGEQVRRDMFYDGNPQWEPGAVVCRVAQSFTRFGNFEIFSARNDVELLKKLADFTIQNDFPHLLSAEKEINRDVYIKWFEEVCIRTAKMIAHWMRVGFVHGVMNTDNMSILGLTIDYGPYGWLEGYDPDWTPNTTDAQGKRYRYINQPQVALWNLAQLGNAIYPLVDAVEPLQAALNSYRHSYSEQWQTDMVNKLGLQSFKEDDLALIDELHRVLELTETDMTIFYRLLANVDISLLTNSDDKALIDVVKLAYYAEPSTEATSAMAKWLRQYLERVQQDYIVHGESQEQRKLRMNRTNPKYVLRNYMAQQAIDKATEGDYSEVQLLLDLLRNPYDEQPDFEPYFAKRPEWARTKAGCSMLSCSS